MLILPIVGAGTNNIQLFAREPRFTSLDEAFLQALNIKAVSTNEEIQPHITPSSFVFAPYVDWTIMLPLYLKDRDPMLYLGNKVQDNYERLRGNQSSSNTRECGEIGKAFLLGKSTFRVPDFPLDMHALRDLRAYYREAKEEEADQQDSPQSAFSLGRRE